MTTATLTAPAVAPTEIDPALGMQIGDELLLGAAARERVSKVQATGGRAASQSHTARAWTLGGQVD